RFKSVGASILPRRAPATATNTVTSHRAAMAPAATESGWPVIATSAADASWEVPPFGDEDDEEAGNPRRHASAYFQRFSIDLLASQRQYCKQQKAEASRDAHRLSRKKLQHAAGSHGDRRLDQES